MSIDIRTKKGLNIQLVGEAQKEVESVDSGEIFTIRPADFHAVIPKLLQREGAKVKVGTALFYNKEIPEMKFTSPVSGTLTEVIRGEKRKLLALRITSDQKNEKEDFGIESVDKLDAETIKNKLLNSGCWSFIKQRPYDIIADPTRVPKAIFISACDSAPLTADCNFTLENDKEAIQTALDALSKLTDGKIHVSVRKKEASVFSGAKGVTLHTVSGPHPSGNVSTQIAKINPINKGEIVWTVSPHDLKIIGTLFLSGTYNPERTIALAGSSVESPKYYKTIIGAAIKPITTGKLKEGNHRIISGTILTGSNEGEDGTLGFYDTAVTVIPEGDDYELFGWNKPIFNKISITRALTFSWLFPKKKYNLNTSTNGELRAFVLTGFYENVFPLAIYPMQLLKSCLYSDIDEMENLGLYEVAPEDFALTEFVCVSKQPHQKIIREGLDLLLKEIGY